MTTFNNIPEKILITFNSNKSSQITLELEDGKGRVEHCGVYHFDQADKINYIVSDLSLLMINEKLGNILFTVIEDWLEA